MLGIRRQISAVLAPHLEGEGDLPEDTVSQVTALEAQADALAGGDALAFLQRVISELETDLLFDRPEFFNGNEPNYPVDYVAEIERPSGVFYIRGKTRPRGQYTLFVPRGAVVNFVRFYDPRTKGYAVITPFVSPSSRYPLPDFFLVRRNDRPDADQDGLPDASELVYGTDPLVADSDNDGIKDGDEIHRGENPLDGFGAASGVIQAAPGRRPSRGVAAFNNLAALAQGTNGVAFYNIFNSMQPTLVAEVDTPGDAQAVAFNREFAAVADSAGGLAILDIRDLGNARHVRQVSFGGGSNVVTVAVAGRLAFAGIGFGDRTSVVAIDLATGEERGRVETVGVMQEVTVDGENVFVLTDSRLYTLTFADGTLRYVEQAPAGGNTGGERVQTLFVGGGFAYATDARGYRVFDVSEPRDPRRLGYVSDLLRNWRAFVYDGFGFGLARNGPFGDAGVSVYDVSTPLQQNNYLTSYGTLGPIRGLTLYNGLGYLADETNGLVVVSYRDFDRGTNAPNVRLRTPLALGRAEPDTLLRATAFATDDVQVKNVEFFIDGALAATDGNFPYEVWLRTPARSQTKTNFTLRARATDTGGNYSFSDTLRFDLVADATPPQPVELTPPNRSVNTPDSVSVVSVKFAAPIDAGTFTTNSFLVFNAGTDGSLGNGDDVFVPPSGTAYDAASATASLNFAAPLPIGLYRAVLRAPLAHTNGNTLAEDFSWTFRVKAAAVWVKDGDGNWSDATNWLANVVPVEDDNVIIDRPAGEFTVTFSTLGGLRLSSVRCTETLRLQGDMFLKRPSSIHNLTLESTLSGPSDVEVTGHFRWLARSVAGRSRLILRGTAEVPPSFIQRTLDERTLVNAGTMTIRGFFEGLNGARLENQAGAVMDAATDGAFLYTRFVGRLPSFDNAGTLRKSGGTGAFQIVETVFNNRGLIEVQSGRIEVVGGGPAINTGPLNLAANTEFVMSVGDFQFNAGSAYSGEGFIRINNSLQAGVASVNTDLGRPNFSVQSGRLAFNTAATARHFTLAGGTVEGALTVLSNLTWTGGTMRGPAATTNAPGALMTVGGSFQRLLDARPLFNFGTVRLDSGFSGINGAVIHNLAGGLFEMPADTSFGYICCVGATPVFNNAGTLRKSGGAGTSPFPSVSLNNRGRVEVQTGALELSGNLDSTSSGIIHTEAGARFQINLVNNVLTVTEGATFTGGGTNRIVSGHLQVNSDVSAPRLDLAGGSVRGPGKFTVLQTLNWTGGNMTGPGTTEIAPGALLNVRGGSLDARTLNNAGTMAMTAGIGGLNGAVLNNLVGGLIDLQGDVGFSYVPNVGATPVLNNAGTLRKSAGTGDSRFLSVALTNSGAIEIQRGALNLNSAGRYVQTAAGTLALNIGGLNVGSGFGRLAVAGRADLAGALTLTLVNGYEPNLNDTFSVLTYGSRAGAFTALNGLGIGNGKQFQTNYTASALSLQVVPNP
ncbi:MAG: hypothetical protein L0Z50_36500 [Verrucomicrobiales bacterium]|nr:hypothetical protein [Verrucomicrobiales bacterium]